MAGVFGRGIHRVRQWTDTFKRGLSLDNPLTVLMIGLCATLAVSTQVEGAFFMGSRGDLRPDDVFDDHLAAQGLDP